MSVNFVTNYRLQCSQGFFVRPLAFLVEVYKVFPLRLNFEVHKKTTRAHLKKTRLHERIDIHYLRV